MPIRKGDGTGIFPHGISEVRKGDGTLLWVSEQFVDNFEHNDLASYYLVSGTGWDTTTASALDGTYGLYNDSSTGNDIFSLPSDHPNYSSADQPETLPNYPVRGDTFEFFVNWQVAVNFRRIQYCMQGYSRSDAGYRIEIDETSGTASDWRIRLRYDPDGSGYSNLDWGDTAIHENEWLRFEVEIVSGGGHTLDVYDSTETLLLALSHASETHHDSGGVGHWASGTQETYFDSWRLL